MIKKTDFSAIKAHSEERIRNKILVGCVTEVNINGETVWSSVHGMADISEQKKMSRDAIFRLASMSKPITGAAVMQLVEKGRLGLYDDISKYIPQLKNFGIAGQNEQGEIIRIADASRGITLFDLLNHSSGLAQDTLGFYQYDTMNFRPQKGEKLSDVIPKYKDILLDCDPGTAMGYGSSRGV